MVLEWSNVNGIFYNPLKLQANFTRLQITIQAIEIKQKLHFNVKRLKKT